MGVKLLAFLTNALTKLREENEIPTEVVDQDDHKASAGQDNKS